MAIKFLTSEFCYLGSASFLDGITALSVHFRVRFDTVGAGSQFVFRHRLGTTGDQISVRKDSGGKLRWSVTAAGTSSTRDSVFTPAAATVYDILLTWQQGQSTGMFIYLNGALDTSGTSTTGQGTYDSLGGNLVIAARESPLPSATEYGQCTLEHLTFWPGQVLTLAHALALYEGAWPHQLAVPAPAIFLPMFGDQVATLIDWSGNDRKIIDGASGNTPPSDIIGGATEANYLRVIQDPWPDQGAFVAAGASSGASPNPWTLHQQYTHPTAAVTLSGLTPGTTYELKVTALDQATNESVDSEVVEAVAQSAVIRHTRKLRFVG